MDSFASLIVTNIGDADRNRNEKINDNVTRVRHWYSKIFRRNHRSSLFLFCSLSIRREAILETADGGYEIKKITIGTSPMLHFFILRHGLSSSCTCASLLDINRIAGHQNDRCFLTLDIHIFRGDFTKTKIVILFPENVYYQNLPLRVRKRIPRSNLR